MLNKMVKYTPAAKSAACAGQPTLRFGCPLPRRYAENLFKALIVR